MLPNECDPWVRGYNAAIRDAITSRPPEDLAERWHRLYEENAPYFGFEATDEFWEEISEEKQLLLMEVAKHVLHELAEGSEEEQDRAVEEDLLEEYDDEEMDDGYY